MKNGSLLRLERFNGNQQNFTTAAMVLSDGPENQGEKVKIIMFSFSGNNRQFRNQQSAASMSQVMFSFMKQALQNQKMENNWRKMLTIFQSLYK